MPYSVVSILGPVGLMVYSLAAGAPRQAANQHIAVQFKAGKSAKQNSGWRAYATVIFRYIKNSLAVVANGTVNGSFAPVGVSGRVTASTGSWHHEQCQTQQWHGIHSHGCEQRKVQT